MFLFVYESVLCIQVCLSVTSRQAGGGDRVFESNIDNKGKNEWKWVGYILQG